MMRVEVNNLPDYAMDYEYIVVRVSMGQAWFYGAFDRLEKAMDVADEVRGLVVYNDRRVNKIKESEDDCKMYL